jgi:N-methylhydantoinase B
MLESTYPVTFEAYTLVPDSGGAGELRGGCGLIRAFRIDAPGGTLACNFDRFKTRPYGLAGGTPGAASFAELQRADGTIVPLASKVAGMAIARGDVFRLVTAGGGGYGEPAKRNRAAIQADIEDGYVSREAAAALYDSKAD